MGGVLSIVHVCVADELLPDPETARTVCVAVAPDATSAHSTPAAVPTNRRTVSNASQLRLALLAVLRIERAT